jgi:hypothetical protein
MNSDQRVTMAKMVPARGATTRMSVIAWLNRSKA